MSIAFADEMEDEVEIESIDARRDSIAELSVTDMAHVGDLDAGCLVQGAEYRKEMDETDELTDELVQVAPNMGGKWLRPRRESCAKSVGGRREVTRGGGRDPDHPKPLNAM